MLWNSTCSQRSWPHSHRWHPGKRVRRRRSGLVRICYKSLIRDHRSPRWRVLWSSVRIADEGILLARVWPNNLGFLEQCVAHTEKPQFRRISLWSWIGLQVSVFESRPCGDLRDRLGERRKPTGDRLLRRACSTRRGDRSVRQIGSNRSRRSACRLRTSQVRRKSPGREGKGSQPGPVPSIGGYGDCSDRDATRPVPTCWNGQA